MALICDQKHILTMTSLYTYHVPELGHFQRIWVMDLVLKRMRMKEELPVSRLWHIICAITKAKVLLLKLKRDCYLWI